MSEQYEKRIVELEAQLAAANAVRDQVSQNAANTFFEYTQRIAELEMALMHLIDWQEWQHANGKKPSLFEIQEVVRKALEKKP